MLDLESFITEAEAESLTLVKGPDRLTEVAAGSDVRIACEVESADPVTFVWTFNTDSIKSRPSTWGVERQSETREVLTINGVTEGDAGTVGCTVRSVVIYLSIYLFTDG